MINIVMNILFGILPEILFYTLSIIFIKDINDKRTKLFLLNTFIYIICICFQELIFAYYLLFIILTYSALKFLYKNKTQLIDIFIICLSSFYMTILSFISIKLFNNNLSNYFIVLIFNRIALFIPFLFKNNFNNLYKKYCKFWNRNDNEKRPIKSLTLRNISLISLNSFILLLNITITEMIKLKK